MTEEVVGIQSFDSPIPTQPIPTAIKLEPSELVFKDEDGETHTELGFEITIAHAAGVNIFYGPTEVLQDFAKQAVTILRLNAQNEPQKLVVADMSDIRNLGTPRSEHRS